MSEEPRRRRLALTTVLAGVCLFTMGMSIGMIVQSLATRTFVPHSFEPAERWISDPLPLIDEIADMRVSHIDPGQGIDRTEFQIHPDDYRLVLSSLLPAAEWPSDVGAEQATMLATITLELNDDPEVTIQVFAQRDPHGQLNEGRVAYRINDGKKLFTGDDHRQFCDAIRRVSETIFVRARPPRPEVEER